MQNLILIPVIALFFTSAAMTAKAIKSRKTEDGASAAMFAAFGIALLIAFW